MSCASLAVCTAVTWGIMGLSCSRQDIDAWNSNIKVFLAVPDTSSSSLCSFTADWPERRLAPWITTQPASCFGESLTRPVEASAPQISLFLVIYNSTYCTFTSTDNKSGVKPLAANHTRCVFCWRRCCRAGGSQSGVHGPIGVLEGVPEGSSAKHFISLLLTHMESDKASLI